MEVTKVIKYIDGVVEAKILQDTACIGRNSFFRLNTKEYNKIFFKCEYKILQEQYDTAHAWADKTIELINKNNTKR